VEKFIVDDSKKITMVILHYSEIQLYLNDQRLDPYDFAIVSHYMC